ncbi:MAG TPA: pitrilysin family protein [Gemmatimonadota bacterium]|nr:pitrilysin family protein [Gemmatimonadota bacterium]
MATDQPRFPFVERTLDNGLRVVVHPDHSAPVVAVHVMYHVGSKNERPGKTGFAHLFEHLLFQGSEHVEGTEHMRIVQDAGGSMNGSTWFDRTNYYETLPSNRLDLALWLESDRMGFFLPAISQAKLDNQRDVVKNERRQSYENRPYGLAVETVLEATFPEGHPYRHPAIGYMEDLDAATLDDVTGFFRTWYGPANATLVVAGDVTVETAVERARHWFGDIRGERPPAPPELVPRPPRRVDVRITDEVSVPRVYLAFPAPSFTEPGFEAADVLTSLLADGRSTRLYASLVHERRVAADVSAYVWPTESVGLLWVVATARPGVDARSLEAEIRAVLDGLREQGPTARELAGARNRSRRQLVRQLDSVGRRADMIAHATVYRGEPDYVNTVFGRYDAIDEAEVMAIAGRVLDPDDGTALHVVPEEEG